MSAALAIEKHGACASCSTDRAVAWHDGPCPWGEPMRDRYNAVPCRELTCRRMTYLEAFCCARCEATYEARMAARLVRS